MSLIILSTITPDIVTFLWNTLWVADNYDDATPGAPACVHHHGKVFYLCRGSGRIH